MAPKKREQADFALRDCALIPLGTGVVAQNLREFREGFRMVEAGSIYHHFWGRLLQPQFDEPEYNNDFSSWAHRALHEKALAERLSTVDPRGRETVEEIREELLEIVETHLDESELVPWARADQAFHFLKSQIIVFDTGHVVETPEALTRVLPAVSPGSFFYHFIDARRRTEQSRDDFSLWLLGRGPEFGPLVELLEGVDPYFSSLRDTQAMTAELVRYFFSGKED
jgi:hypothetical protein